MWQVRNGAGYALMNIQGQGSINHNRSRFSAVRALLGLMLVLPLLSACTSLLKEAEGTAAIGTVFQKTLYSSNMSLAQMRSTQGADQAAEFYASRALSAAPGSDLAPLAAQSAEQVDAKRRLDAAFALGGRDKVAELMATTQTAYDCWVYETSVDVASAAGLACRNDFVARMVRLEEQLAPKLVQPVGPSKATYTVYFSFDESLISAEALEVLTAAIDQARREGHSRIHIGGYTDTAGSAEYNDGLSVRRAQMVETVLIELGALEEAIEIMGYGETFPQVQTGDGVREPLNRRGVVTLLP
ncbi:MAG: OmpA family protein [Parvibaculaceae bacterium]|jgi:outer membrane protein OmpA-like peptidoglycan-associated protein|nr:OmpA family protein [Parvibaculaceae bacterium]